MSDDPWDYDYSMLQVPIGNGDLSPHSIISRMDATRAPGRGIIRDLPMPMVGRGKATKSNPKVKALEQRAKRVPAEPKTTEKGDRPEPGYEKLKAKMAAAGKDIETEHPVSGGKVKLKTPYSQMNFETRHTGDELKSRRMDPEELLGHVGLPLYGDKTVAGQTLTSLGGVPLSKEQKLQGGARYGLEAGDQIWASGQGRMTKLSDTVQQLEDQYGMPVLGTHVAMGPAGGDFAKMTLGPLLNKAKDEGLSPEARMLIDKIMGDRKGFPGMDAVMENPDAWLASNASGGSRADLVKAMAQGRVREAGGPDVPNVRKAITDPELVNEELLTTGHGVGRFDRGAPLSKSKHETYPVGVGGKYLGDLGQLPYDWIFQKFAKGRPKGEDPTRTGYTIERALPHQVFDKEWLENFRRLEAEANR